MRDHTRLKVFELADRLVLSVYRESCSFPAVERYGLQSQMRRAVVSVAANIVEGCARTTQTEYLRFIEIAYASARELQYEIDLCGRLGLLSLDASRRLGRQSTETAKALNGLLRSLQKN
jgi:four helix bundle protein